MWLRITLGDMKESIKDNGLLPKNIVGMLRLDYFDDAVGQVEGFQIFGDFMQHGTLSFLTTWFCILICPN